MDVGTGTGEALASHRDEIRFGRFSLLPLTRSVLQNGTRVHLGNRAFDILHLLVENPGSFVTNDEIVARVWPRTVVVESNLRVHMAAIRKALGDGRDGERYIINVPNNGYKFIAPVERITNSSPLHLAALQSPGAAPSAAHRNVPAQLNRIIGRDAAIQSLARLVETHRLVTLIGAGGIGKTTVAVSVATTFAAQAQARATPTRWTAVCFADLALLPAPDFVPRAVASLLGLNAPADDAMPGLLAYLHDKSLLLVLDNCEHVACAVAELAERIQGGAPQVHILATSREPLRAGGERVQRLEALALPGCHASTASEAICFGAIELFVERASAMASAFRFEDTDVATVVEICRRLDGIPLAIELAAARVESLGVRGVAAGLDDWFSLLSKGRRTALPRHQALEATLDWSYGLLEDGDQAILLRLSTFAGTFTLDDAVAVSAWGSLTASDVLDGVADLVAKSLIAADVTGDEALFRLLETTRSYAALRLSSTTDASQASQRHAKHCLDVLASGQREWTSTPPTAWVKRYGRWLGDARAALSWSFAEGGDLHLGVALTAKAAPLLFQLSLADEERACVKRALDVMKNLGEVDPQLEFELSILYGHAVFHTQGLRPESDSAFARALEIAQATGDQRQLALAYSTSWMGAYTTGEPARMQEFSRQFLILTRDLDDPAIRLLYDRMDAATLHFLGDQRGARICAERSLATRSMVRSPFLSGAQIDRRVSMGTILTRVLWLLGLPLQANKVAVETIDVAVSEGEGISLAFVLGFAAIPLALWSGCPTVARERLDLALRHTAEHSLTAWRNYGLAFEPLLLWHEQGQVGTPVLPQVVGMAARPPQLSELLATLHPALVDSVALARGAAGKAGWCQPELLRLRGDALTSDPSQAESLYLESLASARVSGTLAWEVRTALSLARLRVHQKREREAFDDLDIALAKIKEGFSTPDVRAAVHMHAAIASSLGIGPRQFPDSDGVTLTALPTSLLRRLAA
jgi:predicted ATPase/DNA-binding winged helix-turn-helix (wHTH) protein